MWLLVIFCLLLGLFIGFQIPVFLPVVYSKYMSIAILAALDSVLVALELIWKIFRQAFSLVDFVNILLAADWLISVIGWGRTLPGGRGGFR